MSLEYIRNYYKVPAEPGRRVTYTGGTTPIDGTIVGAKGQYLVLHLENEPKPHHAPFHPTWKIEYSDTIGSIPDIQSDRPLSKRNSKPAAVTSNISTQTEVMTTSFTSSVPSPTGTGSNASVNTQVVIPRTNPMNLTILSGDCRDILIDLPDASVQCCVTSPPYWKLRDYNGNPRQIGQEPTPIKTSSQGW